MGLFAPVRNGVWIRRPVPTTQADHDHPIAARGEERISSRAATGAKDLRQDNRVVVLVVVRPVHESQWSLSRATAELAELLPLISQFSRVAKSKLLKPLRVVTEPTPQLVTRCDCRSPFVQTCLVPAHAARPQPVDQHAVAVRGSRWLVGALEPYVHP